MQLRQHDARKKRGDPRVASIMPSVEGGANYLRILSPCSDDTERASRTVLGSGTVKIGAMLTRLRQQPLVQRARMFMLFNFVPAPIYPCSKNNRRPSRIRSDRSEAPTRGGEVARHPFLRRESCERFEVYVAKPGQTISATLIAVSAQFLQCILHDVSMSGDYVERNRSVLDGERP